MNVITFLNTFVALLNYKNHYFTHVYECTLTYVH